MTGSTGGDGSVERFHEALRGRIGSFASTVRYHSKDGHICPICGGPKPNSRDQLCFQCGKTREEARRQGYAGQLADTVRCNYYAFEGIQLGGLDQMYQIMKGYKRDFNDPWVVESYQTTLRYILADALIIHFDSIGELAGGTPPDVWTVIPSSITSRRHGQRHPLSLLVENLQLPIPEAILVSQHEKLRVFDPDMFIVKDPDAVKGRRVLLIDDSWTTGNSIQSAAVALKRAGAAYVTVYCIARIINSSYWKEKNPAILQGFERMRYPHRDPFLITIL